MFSDFAEPVDIAVPNRDDLVCCGARLQTGSAALFLNLNETQQRSALRVIPHKKIRVLIVDDSVVVRKVLAASLAGEPDIEVAGTAPDPVVALERLPELNPDVITLDIDMPRMDGLTFLRKLMAARPVPVIVISSLGQAASACALEAMALGAVEVLAKPAGPFSVGDFRHSLARKVRAAASARVIQRHRDVATADESSAPVTQTRASLIAMGASTGGVQALERILVALPVRCPPVVVVQHIPAGFSRAFAERLSRVCSVRVIEAEDGRVLAEGEVALAPGNRHMRVNRSGGRIRLWVGDGPPVSYQRPSVDVLFDSIASRSAAGVWGVILTGMGCDGAAGLLRMKRAGAHTIAQDESSSVVFGMPKEAIRIGAINEVLPLERIAARLAEVSGLPQEPAAETAIVSAGLRR